MKMLEIEGLEVRYGQVLAVRGIDLYAEQGEVLTILAANGAGKTSTVRAIAGAVPYRGSIRVGGEPLPHKPWKIRQGGIAHAPEGRHVFGRLTVLENLRLGAFGRRFSPDEAFELFPRLHERRNQHAGTLSGGEQQMLVIGRALMSSPRLLLLDEPTLGLAPTVCDDIFERIGQIAAQGVTILLVEQKTASALELSDHVIVMRRGQIIARGEPGDFADPGSLAAAYLDG